MEQFKPGENIADHQFRNLSDSLGWEGTAEEFEETLKTLFFRRQEMDRVKIDIKKILKRRGQGLLMEMNRPFPGKTICLPANLVHFEIGEYSPLDDEVRTATIPRWLYERMIRRKTSDATNP